MDPVKSKEPQRDNAGAPTKIKLLDCAENKTDAVAKVKYHESRRNSAACFRTQTVSEPHYCGVLTLENLPSGSRVWVNVAVREIQTGKRIGQKYLSITLRPMAKD
jgi:hypothetical protein